MSQPWNYFNLSHVIIFASYFPCLPPYWGFPRLNGSSGPREGRKFARPFQCARTAEDARKTPTHCFLSAPMPCREPFAVSSNSTSLSTDSLLIRI